MSDGHRLLEIMREAGKTPQNEIVDLILGTVISTQPLKIKVENRELTESFLILGAMCKEYRIFTDNETAHTHAIHDTYTGGGSSDPTSHRHGILVWRGIRSGDKVMMIKLGRGQKYYVLQREEGLSQ